MISLLQFNTGYPTQLKGIGKREIIFNGWTNVLFGPNGSGKTTILRTLAMSSGCGGGGWSDGGSPEELPFSATVESDDRPVFYQDCYQNSEESFIDSDYLESHVHLRSSGEKRIGLVNELVNYIENRFLTYKLQREDRPTLLLDEVDNHIGFAGQAILWGEIFPKLSKKYQLIISTHSIFPILLRRENSIKPDNIISLAAQYPEICIQELERAVKFFNSNGAEA
ncbi:MAG: AAA family ATPase [Spirochaetes bacterium]|nr:MAG: AAA family ATPase [Spirochaetota bacterium]RKX83525.1 MAG: AAA family ATPase [Spirochaetota bacterium]